MKITSLFLILLLAAGIRLNAQVNEVDLNFALAQLKTNGLFPFAKILYADNQESAKQTVDQLGPLLRASGDYAGFEILSRRNLTKRVERLVIVLNFDNFPIYMRIDYYDNSKQKICLPAKFSREAAEILPFDLISATGK